MEHDTQIQRLADHLNRAPDPRGITRGQIGRLFGGHLNRQQISDLITHLVDTGDYETATEPTNGRPRTWIRRTPPKPATEQAPIIVGTP